MESLTAKPGLDPATPEYWRSSLENFEPSSHNPGMILPSDAFWALVQKAAERSPSPAILQAFGRSCVELARQRGVGYVGISPAVVAELGQLAFPDESEPPIDEHMATITPLFPAAGQASALSALSHGA